MAKKTGKRKAARNRIQPEDKTVTRGNGRDQEKREDESDETGRFDFGGFPARDLKKNLGCG